MIQYRELSEFSVIQYWELSEFSVIQYRELSEFSMIQYRELSEFSTIQYWELSEFSMIQYRELSEFSMIQHRYGPCDAWQQQVLWSFVQPLTWDPPPVSAVESQLSMVSYRDWRDSFYSTTLYSTTIVLNYHCTQLPLHSTTRVLNYHCTRLPLYPTTTTLPRGRWLGTLHMFHHLTIRTMQVWHTFSQKTHSLTHPHPHP
jgi:hypothetical protein